MNPEARQLSVGGICEDAITGVLSGIASFGHAVGVGSSYGAFMAPLGHVPARLHAIGQQARKAASGEPYNPIVLVCGHAGLKTGEDGPTHADPQALQLLQQDFPLGTADLAYPMGAAGDLAAPGHCAGEAPRCHLGVRHQAERDRARPRGARTRAGRRRGRGRVRVARARGRAAT